MNGAANRRRGQNAERAVVAHLRSAGWPDAVTTRNTGGAGGQQVGDVAFAPGISLEVKDVAQRRWNDWLKQAEAQADGRIPVVVHRVRGIPNVGVWPCALPWPDWLELGGSTLPWQSTVSNSTAGCYHWLLGSQPEPVVAHRRRDMGVYAVMRFATFLQTVRAES